MIHHILGMLSLFSFVNSFKITLPKHIKLSSSSNNNFVTKSTNSDDGFEVKFDDGFLESLKKKRPYASILIERFMQNIDDFQVSQKVKYASSDKNIPKEKIVVLGSGWGSYSFLKTVDPTLYDITVISPRNYFTFTPMLAASAVGTVEFRSICEPIRNISPYINFIEASALNIDHITKTIGCQSIKCSGTVCEDYEFDVNYDKLLVAVGSQVNTFGIKGVRENCQFLKQIEDAANIRQALAYCFERASIPYLTDEEKRTALTFVIVGAGPTGVELIGELRDWIEVEGRKYFPEVIKYAQIILVEAGKAVLAVFDKELQQEALDRLTNRETKLIQEGLAKQEITRVMLGVGVKEVGEKVIHLSNNESIPYGFCVWAGGVGPTSLVLDLVNKVDEQKEVQSKSRGRVLTDGWLRVKGCDGIFSIGDCNFIEDSPLPATAQVASQQGAYLGRLLSKGYKLGSYNSPTPPYKFIQDKENEPSIYYNENNGTIENTDTSYSFTSNNEVEQALFASEQLNIGTLGVVPDSDRYIDSDSNNNDANTKTSIESPTPMKIVYAKPFQFLNLGALAYVGASSALAQIAVNEKNLLGTGPLGFVLWRGIYWFKQVSWRNRVLIAIDWVKGRIFGRDIGSVTF